MQDMTPPRPVPAEVLARLKAVTGPAGYLDDSAAIEPHCLAWRDGWRGEVPIVMRPISPAEVAEIVKICAETGTPIVTQSGNTGLTGGGQPHMGGMNVGEGGWGESNSQGMLHLGGSFGK